MRMTTVTMATTMTININDHRHQVILANRELFTKDMSDNNGNGPSLQWSRPAQHSTAYEGGNEGCWLPAIEEYVCDDFHTVYCCAELFPFLIVVSFLLLTTEIASIQICRPSSPLPLCPPLIQPRLIRTRPFCSRTLAFQHCQITIRKINDVNQSVSWFKRLIWLDILSIVLYF